jgi:hypothetical protein
MKYELSFLCIIVVAFIGMISAVSGSLQTFPSDFGKIQIDMPYTLTPSSGSSGDGLNLVKPGGEKPVVNIVISDPYGMDLAGFAESHIGKDKSYEEVSTSDGHRMLFYTMDEGTGIDGKPIYDFAGFIDYLKDKGVIVDVFGTSKAVAYGQVVATFDRDAFLSISKSFTFIE